MLLGFGLSGYRSFGEEPQYLYPLKKINVICGANNCGKSNILSFAKSILPLVGGPGIPNINPVIDKSAYSNSPVTIYIPIPLDSRLTKALEVPDDESEYFLTTAAPQFLRKAPFSRTVKDCAFWFPFQLTDNGFSSDRAYQEFAYFLDEDLKESTERHIHGEMVRLLGTMGRFATNDIPSSFNGTPDIVRRSIQPVFQKLYPQRSFVLVSAIRQISDKDKEKNFDETYTGSGAIHYLHEVFQPPSGFRHRRKEEFEPIQNFVKSVLENDTAELMVSFDTSEILVSLDGVERRLGSLGQGVNQVVILGIAATRAKGKIMCIEEPEQNLHPVLQRKLLDYLDSLEGDRQFLISTHSSVFVDHPSAAVFSVRLTDTGSKVERVDTSALKHLLLFDLGYRPSDILQTNCAIWVEGPSDAIYLRYWIREVDNTLIEGRDFSFLYYGGRVLSHFSLDDEDNDGDGKSGEALIRCLQINRRSFLMMDSDKDDEHDTLNKTKNRVIAEASGSNKDVWVTDGREIENYLPANTVEEFITLNYKTDRNPRSLCTDDRFGDRLALHLENPVPKKQPAVNKVELAKWVADHDKSNPKLNPELLAHVERLVAFVHLSGHRKVKPKIAPDLCGECGQEKTKKPSSS